MQETELDDIRLIDYIKVIRKRWIMITLLTAVPVFISYIALHFVPKVYESITLLQFAYIEDKRLESVETTNAILKYPVNPYLVKIAKEFNIPASQSQFDKIISRFSLEETSGLVRLKATGNSPSESLKLVNLISKIIITRHQYIYERERKMLEDSIKAAEKQIDIINKEISVYNKLTINADKINEDKIDSVTRTVLSIGYNDAKEKAWTRYDNLMKLIRENKSILENKVGPTIILGEPVALETPVSPKKRRVLIVSALGGMIFGLFLSFVLEFIEKEKKI